MGKTKPHRYFSVVLNGEMTGTRIRQSELVFSADLCYNEAHEKPLPLGEVAAKPTERAKWSENH